MGKQEAIAPRLTGTTGAPAIELRALCKNYAQWRSKEDLDRFVKKYREHMEAQLLLAERADAHVYKVASLYEPAGR